MKLLYIGVTYPYDHTSDFHIQYQTLTYKEAVRRLKDMGVSEPKAVLKEAMNKAKGHVTHCIQL